MAFIEKTDLEHGFSALWDTEIAPSLDAYRAKYNPRFWLAVIGQLVAILIAIGAYGAALAQNVMQGESQVLILCCVLLAAALMFAAYYPLSKIQGSFDGFMKQVVSDHYGDILLPAETDKNATFLIDQMQTLDMIEHGRRTLSNHYVGTYRDCALEMFNLCLQRGYGRNQTSDFYFLLDVTVPMEFDGEVVIKSDYGRVINFMRGMFSDRKQVKFDHAAFEKRYEVYAENMDVARQLISPEFCDNLLDIPKLFPRSYGVAPARLRGAFHQGRFTLIVPHNDDMFGLWPHQTAPGRVEAGCRRLIARMGIVKKVVDYLHGDR